MELTKSDNGRWNPGQSGNLNGQSIRRGIGRLLFVAGRYRDVEDLYLPCLCLCLLEAEPDI